jgi:hypothetical protein
MGWRGVKPRPKRLCRVPLGAPVARRGAVGPQKITARIGGRAGTGMAPVTATMNVLPPARAGRTFNILDSHTPPARPTMIRRAGARRATPLGRGGAHLPVGSFVRTGSAYVRVYAADAARRQHEIFTAQGSWVLRQRPRGRPELAVSGPLRCTRRPAARYVRVVIADRPFFTVRGRLGAVTSYRRGPAGRAVFEVGDGCNRSTVVSNLGPTITVRVARDARRLRLQGSTNRTVRLRRTVRVPRLSTLRIR